MRRAMFATSKRALGVGTVQRIKAAMADAA
jgi:hypothetical protein